MSKPRNLKSTFAILAALSVVASLNACKEDASASPSAQDSSEASVAVPEMPKLPAEPLVKAKAGATAAFLTEAARSLPSLEEALTKLESLSSLDTSDAFVPKVVFTLNPSRHESQICYTLDHVHGNAELLLANEHIIITKHLISEEVSPENNKLNRYAFHVWDTKTWRYKISVLADDNNNGPEWTKLVEDAVAPHLLKDNQVIEMEGMAEPRLGEPNRLKAIPVLDANVYQWVRQPVSVFERIDFDTLTLRPPKTPAKKNLSLLTDLIKSSSYGAKSISGNEHVWLYPRSVSLASSTSWPWETQKKLCWYHADDQRVYPASQILWDALIVKAGEQEVIPFRSKTARGQTIHNAYGETNRGLNYWQGPHVVLEDGWRCAPIARDGAPSGYSIPDGKYGERNNSRGSSLSVWNPVPGGGNESYWLVGGVGRCELIRINEQNRTGTIVQTWRGDWGCVSTLCHVQAPSRNPIWMPDKKWLCLPMSSHEWHIYALDEKAVKTTLLCYVYTGAKDSWAVVLPNGRYAGSEGCESLFELRCSGTMCPAQSLALWRNRPAEVMKALHGGARDVAQWAQKTQTWLEKQGHTPETLPAEPGAVDLPVARGCSVPFTTDSASAEFWCELQASARDIVRLDVRVNGELVPQPGIKPDQQAEGTRNVLVNIPLKEGENRVELTPVDSAGVSGKGESCRIIRGGAAPQAPVLFSMAAGEPDPNEPDVRALIQEKQWDAVVAFASKGTNGRESALSCAPGIISHALAHQAPIPVIEALLKAGASPDSRVENGKTYGDDTVLVYLVEQISAAENEEQELRGYNVDGMKQLVRLLLEHGANPHKLSAYGMESYVPLVDLCTSQDMVQLFEQYGVFPETQASSADELVLPVYQPNAPVSVTEQGSYPGGVTTPLHRGVHLGNLTRVKAALATPGVNVNARDEKDCTPLMVAAQKDRSSSARMLLNAGADVNAASTRYGTTPLMMAAMNGYHEVVEVLLQYGAAINAQNKSGYTALILAVRGGHQYVAQMLLNNGASPHIKDSSGRTAAQYGYTPQAVQQPVQRPVAVAPSGGFTTPLHRGVHLGNLTRVKEALAVPGVNVNARDEKDCTPLMIAAQKDRGSSARMLLNAGAHVDAASTRYGTTALMMAAMNGYDEVVTVLLQYGASINAQNKSGFTPLMLAARNGRYSTVALLLRHGASKNVRDYSGRTAAQHASTPAIRQLL